MRLETEREGEKRKCLKMRLSHWFKMSNSEGKLEKRPDFNSTHTHAVHSEHDHSLYIGSLHKSNESQYSTP